MAPVDPQVANSNVTPIAAYSVQALWTVGQLVYIVSHLRSASKQLPPSADTRARSTTRDRNIAILSVLSVISLSVTTYFAISTQTLSYQQWAQRKKEPIPNSLWGSWYAGTDEVQLGRWYADSKLRSAVYKELVSRSRGFWWTSQQLSGILVWSIFLGIESRRRHLRKWLTFAFVSTALTSGLSVAQNLFYILMLLTPVPLERSSQRTALWTPHPAVYIAPLLVTLVGLDLLPSFKTHDGSRAVLASAYQGLPYVFALLVQLVPKRFGKYHHDAGIAQRSYTSIFYWFAAATFVFHAKQTLHALYDNAPESQYTHYYAVWSKLEPEYQSMYDRSRTALGRLLNAIADHPAVSYAGWDVLLSGLSYSVWAFLRGLDVSEMLKCSAIPWLNLPEDEEEEHATKHVAFKDEKLVAEAPTSPKKSTRGRPRKTPEPAVALNGNDGKRSTRRRRKIEVEPESESDDAYVPPKALAEAATTRHGEGPGDETLAEEAEASAVAWGLFVLGGLGVVSAATLGAEVRGR